MISKNTLLVYFKVERCGSELAMGTCTLFEPNQIKRVYSFFTRTNREILLIISTNMGN